MASHWHNNIDLYHALPTFLENDAQGFNPYGFSIDDKEIVIELNETTDDNPYVLDWNFLQIFYTGKTNSTSNIQSMRFVCCGNIFDNLLYSSSIFNNFQIVDNIRAIHSNNIFADYYDE